MDNSDLDESLEGNKLYGGSFPCNCIPKPTRKPIAFIVNTDKAGEPGTHWVALLLLDDGAGEYFDSFGLPPFEKSIINYIKDNCTKLVYNDKHIQNNTAKTCGLYCVKFIEARSLGIDMDMFLHMFSKLLPENEKLLPRL